MAKYWLDVTSKLTILTAEYEIRVKVFHASRFQQLITREHSNIFSRMLGKDKKPSAGYRIKT